MNLSKQIKKHRERLSLSQEGLAEKLYVSRQTISNWENEKAILMFTIYYCSVFYLMFL